MSQPALRIYEPPVERIDTDERKMLAPISWFESELLVTIRRLGQEEVANRLYRLGKYKPRRRRA